MVTPSPGEYSDTQMNIGWHAELDQTICTLIVTERAATPWAHARTIEPTGERVDVFDGIESQLPDNQDWNEDAKFLKFGVVLTDLPPNTEYMYKVVSGDDVSAAQFIKTAAPPRFASSGSATCTRTPPSQAELETSTPFTTPPFAWNPTSIPSSPPATSLHCGERVRTMRR